LKIKYLNTDLDLIAAFDLTLLVTALEAQGLISLRLGQEDDGLWYAILETDEQFDEPEPNIAAMLSVIEQFDQPMQEAWHSLKLRRFNIGYDCGNKPWAFNQGMSNPLLQRIAKAGASVRVTLYPPCKNPKKTKQKKKK
jgi:hypothetical protein